MKREDIQNGSERKKLGNSEKKKKKNTSQLQEEEEESLDLQEQLAGNGEREKEGREKQTGARGQGGCINKSIWLGWGMWVVPRWHVAEIFGAWFVSIFLTGNAQLV